MARVVDVALYITTEIGEVAPMKLQRLIYFSQVWCLVWNKHSLFNEDIHAWPTGPAVPALYPYHKGVFRVDHNNFSDGDIGALTSNQKDCINAALKQLKDKSGQELSDISKDHCWKKAREGLSPLEQGNKIMSLTEIHGYYLWVQYFFL
jgi:uncharacterized phage-associated protein